MMNKLIRSGLAASGMLTGLLAFGTVSRAFDLDPAEIRGKSSKEPMTVLQNRAFLKTLRPEFGLTTGFLLDEAYTHTTMIGLRGSLFLTEWIGVEAQMARTKVSDSEDRKALRTLRFRPLTDAKSANASANGTTVETIVTPDPEVNSIHSVTDVSGIVAPFYGKLNVLNKWIIYTDLYGSGGMSLIETDQGNKTGVALGAGERFYIGKSWSVRVDFKDRIFNETRAGQSSQRHSKAVDFGASYFFN